MEDLVLHPLQAVTHAVRAPGHAWEYVTETVAGATHIFGMGGRPPGPFDATIGPARRFATAETPFERVHEIRAALGGTINDVVLTSVAEAFTGCSRAGGRRRAARDGSRLRALASRAGDVGNRVAPAFVDAGRSDTRPACDGCAPPPNS
jgi:hypothetical protein